MNVYQITGYSLILDIYHIMLFIFLLIRFSLFLIGMIVVFVIMLKLYAYFSTLGYLLHFLELSLWQF